MKRILLIFAALAIVSCGCNKPGEEPSGNTEQNNNDGQEENPQEQTVEAASVVLSQTTLTITVGKTGQLTEIGRAHV